MDQPRPLPEFENPPVVEVAIALQFSPLERLSSPHLGLLWGRLKSFGYVVVEEHKALEPAFEEFKPQDRGKVRVRVDAAADQPPARVWFLNESGNELIQVQRDRFVVNWRRGAHDEPYPRYAQIISRFREVLGEFEEFVGSESLGSITPTQCEITYVNHLISGEGWVDHGDLDKVLSMWRASYSEEYLPQPEDSAIGARYRMLDLAGRPLGRLYVEVRPAYRVSDSKPIFVMNLTARGAPRPVSNERMFQLLDLQHEWIVRGFAAITTPSMHRVWGRTDG